MFSHNKEYKVQSEITQQVEACIKQTYEEEEEPQHQLSLLTADHSR